MTRTATRRRGRLYSYCSCGGRQQKGRGICKGRHIPMVRMDDLVVDNVRQHLFTDDRLAEVLAALIERQGAKDKTSQSCVAALEAEIAGHDDRLKRLYRAIEEGVVELDRDLKERIQTLKQQRDIATAALGRARAQNRTVAAITPAKLAAFSMLMRERLQTGDVRARQAYLRSVVARVEVKQNRIRIYSDENALAAAIAGNASGVRGFVRNWRTRRDFELTTSAFGGQRSIQLSYGSGAADHSGGAGLAQRERPLARAALSATVRAETRIKRGEYHAPQPPRLRPPVGRRRLAGRLRSRRPGRRAGRPAARGREDRHRLPAGRHLRHAVPQGRRESARRRLYQERAGREQGGRRRPDRRAVDEGRADRRQRHPADAGLDADDLPAHLQEAGLRRLHRRDGRVARLHLRLRLLRRPRGARQREGHPGVPGLVQGQPRQGQLRFAGGGFGAAFHRRAAGPGGRRRAEARRLSRHASPPSRTWSRASSRRCRRRSASSPSRSMPARRASSASRAASAAASRPACRPSPSRATRTWCSPNGSASSRRAARRRRWCSGSTPRCARRSPRRTWSTGWP